MTPQNGQTRKKQSQRWASKPQNAPRNEKKVGSRVLYLDIETTPILGYSWQYYDTTLIKIVEDWRILCVAYQWENEPMRFIRTKKDDKTLCMALWVLFNKADVIVAQNGDQFDIKKINTRMAYWGLTPPPPYKTVDTLKILRRYFGLTRNSLDFVCDYFGIGRKVKHEGFELWEACMKGDESAWKRMEKYNRRDVWLLKQLWLQKLQMWHVTKPNIGISCKKCGSTNTKFRSWDWRNGQKYRRILCSSCGTKKISDVKYDE